jgi:hypothetical protein
MRERESESERDRERERQRQREGDRERECDGAFYINDFVHINFSFYVNINL